MKILCCNDDGIGARGLEALTGICAGIGEVYTVAPDREQSATSHSLTLFKPLRATPRGPRRWQVDGTPTDCVLLALGALLGERPDFVVSGINHGPNMGEDVLYSGTVAAAMEGLSLGIPGVAISLAGHDLDLLPTYADRLARLLGQILAVRPFPDDTLLNINLPPIPADQVRGVRVTALGSRVYSESLTRMKDPWGRDVYWIGGGQLNWTGGEESDFQAVESGYISVTPLHVDLTSYSRLESVRSWKLGDS
jgi:5'-nucleotidase